MILAERGMEKIIRNFVAIFVVLLSAPMAAFSADTNPVDSARKTLADIDAAGGIDDNTLSEIRLAYEELSQSIKKYDELATAAADARAKETSTANKLLGGAAIGAAGIGASQLLQGRAEQRADDAAAADMRAYLATFACDYGMGRNIRGGETEIVLPGANALLPLYSEYKQLAADLKADKTALGLPLGIESQEIADKAYAGLYDNVSSGRADGTYTSLSRAIMDETSDDAREWSDQEAAARRRVTTGAIVGGVGVVGGAVGNLIINRDKTDDNKNNNTNNNSGNGVLGAVAGAAANSGVGQNAVQNFMQNQGK